MSEADIFAEAITKPAPDRSAYLEDACRGDEQLRRRVEELLAAHDDPDSIFDSPADTEALPSSAPKLPKRLGDFEIIREIGRGGMGIVYEARQVSLNRRVALKVLSSGLGLTAKAVLRFRREAEAAAKLHHTNIVPIYATGEDGGIHFYAMELVEGPSLDRVIRQMRSDSPPAMQESINDDTSDEILPDWVNETIAYQPPSEESSRSQRSLLGTTSSSISSGSDYFDIVAKMTAEVADALEYAHEHGVIHRDIKPSNLLLSPDGRLSVNDFGLARILEQPGMTMTGEFVGSPLYMSPEQISAGRAPLDHRTDVYSLGATLYELLTLQPPFPGRRRDEVIGQILYKEPRVPRRLNKRLPADLETICLKAVERDPDRRYQTAAQLASDLTRFLNRHAIQARRVSTLARAVKWARRHSALAVCYAIIAIMFTALVWLGFGLWHNQLERAKEKTMEAAMQLRFQDAEQHLAEARRLWASRGWLRMLEGQILLHKGNYDEAKIKLAAAEALLPDRAAPYAMLTVAYWFSGDEDGYVRRLGKLEQWDPQQLDFYDKVFQAYAESGHLPRRALKKLDEAVAERPYSYVAKMLRANALLRNSMDAPRALDGIALAERGIADSDSFRVSSPTVPPKVLQDKVHLYLTMATRYRELAEPTKVVDALQAAFTAATELQKQPTSLEALDVLIQYYGVTGDDNSLLELSKAMLADPTRKLPGYSATYLVPQLFRMGQTDLALDAFERAPPVTKDLNQWMRAIIDMHDETEYRGALLERFQQGVARRRDRFSGFYLELDWCALRLMGVPKTEAGIRDMALDVQMAFENYLLEYRRTGEVMAEFMRGDCTPEQFLEATSFSRVLTVYACFMIGVDFLADGDRLAAKKFFEKAVATNVYSTFDYQWSRGFLTRLDDDQWFPWLPNVSRELTTSSGK